MQLMQKRLYFQKIILFIIQALIKNFIINLKLLLTVFYKFTNMNSSEATKLNEQRQNIMNNQNFTIDTNHMSRKQHLNVGRLIAKAGELDFPIDNAMTQIGYNTTYGNTYLWCEDVPYTIFISDFDSTIKALYSCPYDGEETERKCSNDETKMMKWAERLQAKSDKKQD